LGKSWENGGKMVGKMLEICEEFCLGKSLNIDVWDAAHFPTEFCGISSGHLWTRCITCGTMGSGGMVQWTKVTLNSIRSYSFTMFYAMFDSFSPLKPVDFWTADRLSRGRATPCGWAETGKQWLNNLHMGTRCMAL
jgi:hypothetical protein